MFKFLKILKKILLNLKKIFFMIVWKIIKNWDFLLNKKLQKIKK